MCNWPNMMEKAACEKEESGNVGVPDVSSSIVRSKKTEMHVNGCTQRVHAYEGNFLNGHLPVNGELDCVKEGGILSEDLEGGKVYKKPLVGSDVTHMVGQDLANVVDVNNMEILRCRRSGTSLLKSLPIMDKEGHNNEVKGKRSASPSTPPLNVSEIGVLSEHVVGAQDDDEVSETQTNAMEENKEVGSSLVSIKKSNGSGGCSDVLNSNPELEMKNVSSTNLNGKLKNLNDGFPDLQPKDRFLRYTFQRKRKKETLSSERKTGKKQNSSFEQSHSGSGGESSRHGRRMAQVARQLVSLSDKKWWN